MSSDGIQQLIDSMEPQQAVSTIAEIMKKLFPLLDEEARLKFVVSLVGEPDQDKVASLVHL